MSASNFVTIRQRVQDRLYGKSSVLRGTVDSGSTTTIVDAAAALAGATADHYDYGFAKITTDTVGAAPQGEVRALSEGLFAPTTGTFTLVAALSAATGAGDTYEIWPDKHPDDVDIIINRKLRELHVPSFYPLTLDLVASDNNDFESATALTGWTNNGVMTAAKETTRIYNGTRADKLTHTTAATQFASRQFSVTANKTYWTAAVGSCDDGDTAILRVVNASAANALIEDGRTAQTNMQEIVFYWTAPSGCRTAEVRLMGLANTDVSYWDDYQTWSNEAYVYPLPSWITRKEQLINVVAFPPGTGGPSNDFDYRANERNSRQLPFRFERADTRATNELFIWVQTYSNWRPYIVAYRPLDEVAADYVTTVANTVPLSSTEVDGLVLGVLAEMHRELIDRTTGETRAKHEREAILLERQYASAVRHLVPEGRGERVEHRRIYGSVA